MDQKPIQKLINKPMDRREFLAHVGAGVLTVVGVSGLLKNLIHHPTKTHSGAGYGSSPYGGGSKK